jgi:hypothetical protein
MLYHIFLKVLLKQSFQLMVIGEEPSLLFILLQYKPTAVVKWCHLYSSSWWINMKRTKSNVLK